MPPKVPDAVVRMMASRAHRMHHYLWHNVRNGWLGFSADTRDRIRDLGWEPPRPARRPTPGGPSDVILDNGSGEDFLYMHRDMIAAVDRKLGEISDPAYPRVQGWTAPPPPGDPDWPVPLGYSLGDPDGDAYLAECKSDAFYSGPVTNWMRAYRDPAALGRISLGELGSRIEFTIHNRMHMRWSAEPASFRPDVEPAAPDAIDTSWDAPSYDWLGDTYSSHVNAVFWKLHGWVDDCVGAWMKANGKDGSVPWTGTWVGPMPTDAPSTSIFAHSPSRDRSLTLHHHDHMANMVAVARVLRNAEAPCHFYDAVVVPPLP